MEQLAYQRPAAVEEGTLVAFETGLRHIQRKLGNTHPLLIGGQRKKASGTFSNSNPADQRMLLGRFQRAGASDATRAVASAHENWGDWRELGWPQRVAFLQKAAELMAARRFDLAAILCLESGRTRSEAISEVSETIELIASCCDQMEKAGGYETILGESSRERSVSILKPHGVWAVISPADRPLLHPACAAAAALIAGNTVVFAPAEKGSLAGLVLYETFHDAGLPVGVFNLITGGFDDLSAALCRDSRVRGLALGAWHDPGIDLIRRFCRDEPERVCSAELSAKNPVVVMPSAHLENAVEGVLHLAFGKAGQSASAGSRIYVHRQIAASFAECLVETVRNRKIGNPLDRDTFMGPLQEEQAVKRYERAVRIAKKEGIILHGGARLSKGDLEHGFFVEPLVVQQTPPRSALLREECFAPVAALCEIRSLDEGIERANDIESGFSAAIYTHSESEQDRFCDETRADAVYANRASEPMTPPTRAFPPSHPTGHSMRSPHFLPRFMREQLRTLVR